MVGLFGCWQNVGGLNAVVFVVGAITGPVRACVYACHVRVCVIYYLYQPTDHPNVNRNIIELMKVKVLAQSQKCA